MKIKNRLLASVLCLLTVVFCSVGLTACGAKCTHQWGEWSIKTNATCTEEGIKERKCTECGEIEASTIDTLGHIDEDKNHLCGYNCGENIGTCEDSDKDHACDYLCNAEGGYLAYNDDAGYNNNFKITYELKAGETYIVKVRWYSSSRAGNVVLFFGGETSVAE